MNLNQKIQSFLNKHKSAKRRLSATALLSMLITLSVISSLIMPAISMTIPGAMSVMESVSLYSATPGNPDVIPGTGMLDLLSANEWAVNIGSNNGEIYSATDETQKTDPITFKSDTSPLNLNAYIAYTFTGDVKSFLVGSGPHLGWDLGNSDLTAIFPDGATSGDVDDSMYSKEIPAGTYIIKDGRVEITLTPEYIAYVTSGQGDLKGSIEFDGELKSSSDESGNQKFIINGQEVIVDFPDKWPTIDKTSWVNESNGTIKWTIQIQNPNYVALDGYTLTDDMLKNAVDGNVTITPSSAGTYDGQKIVFDPNYKDNATIEYVTKITEDQLKKVDGSQKNHAELKKNDGKISEDDETANLWKEPFTVNKNGTPDYQTQGGSYNKEINWEITIRNEYGGSLEGYFIEDANIPSSGVTITPSGSLTSDGGKWKLTGTGDASAVTIKYTTDAVNGSNKNNVKLYYTDGKTKIDEKEPDVKYEDKKALISLAKNGNANTSNGTIEWTITISNQNGMDLTDYELSDDMLKNPVSGSIQINPANAASQPDSNGVIKLTADAKNSQWITIKYSTALTPEQLRSGTAHNEAVLKDPKDPDPIKDPSDPTFTANPFYIRKTGEPDYKSGSYPDSDNKIKWKVEVTSQSGVSLDGYIIKDDAIPPASSPIKTSSGTLKYVGGQTIDGVSYGLGEWQLSNTGNAKYITIEYEAPVSETGGIGNENVNDVELKYPDDEPTGKTDEGKVTYKSENDLVGLNKRGNYAQDSHEITWTINVIVEGGYDITGYTIYDDMFKNVDISDIQINYQPASNFATLDKSTGNLTFTSKPNSDNFNITYKTKVDIKNTDSGTITVNNGYGPGPGPGKENATVDVPVRDELKKQLNSSKYEEIPHSGKLVRTLNWTANITHDGTFDGLTYVDNLTASAVDAHIITDEQLAAIRVYGKVSEYDYNRTQLTKGIDYELVPNNNNNGFTITFKNTLDEKGYNFVDIEYQTTATSNAVKPGTSYPVTSEFSNGADFNGNHVSDKFTITRSDPEIHTTLNLHLTKDWSNDDTSIRPANAYFKVLYHTGDYQWKSVKFASNGGYLFSGDSGYSSATELVTLNGDGNTWSKTFEELPRRIRKANDDGSVGSDLTYYYKIEEVKSDGSSIENNLLDVDGGSYQVGYTNNNGVGNKDDIYISANNTLYRERNITPQKTWSGDTGSGTGINSITVQLEYSTDGYNYYPVRKNASGYVFDQSSTDSIVTQEITGTDKKWIGSSWDNLPQIIPMGTGSATCNYRIREIKYNDTEISGDKFIADGGYYNISYGTDNGNLAVINEYKANKSVSYNVKKLWNNDTAYMANRPETIIVRLKQTGSDGTTKYYDNPVELNAGNGWQNTWSGLPYQYTNKESGEIVTYTYTAEEVGYIKDGKTVDITQNYFATSSDGWYNISYDNYSIPNNTTISNTFEPVSTIAITPQKKWVGDSELNSEDNPFSLKNRPQNITLKLQRKLDNTGNWEDVSKDDVSEIDANNPYTVQLSSVDLLEDQYSTDVVWQGAAIGNLPSTIVTFDADGKSTKHSCDYRLIEWKYTPNENAKDTIEKEIGINDTSFKTDDGKYVIDFGSTRSGGDFVVTNTFEESIGITKILIDSQGNEITSIDKEVFIAEDSPFRKTIGNDKYYVFNWVIDFESLDYLKSSPIIDILPEGFTLIESSSYNTVEKTIQWGGYVDELTPFDSAKELGNADGYYLGPVVIWNSKKEGIASGANTLKFVDEETVWRWSYITTRKDEADPSKCNPPIPITDEENSRYNFSEKIDSSYYYDSSTRKIYFTRQNLTSSPPPQFVYSTKIKCEDLEARLQNGSYIVKNDAERYDKYGNPTGKTTYASFKIINKTPKDLITKIYAGETRIPGYFKYSIDVNPEGKNLSTGDTIDIQDLLETVSYFDHDIGGAAGTTYRNNKRFVDILMDSITLYEVDANGNKVPLPENKYTRIFKNGDQVSDGAALLQLTIPDETHIVVDYTYKMIANETTPSVINGCKSSTRVNGRYATMQPGFVPPAGDKITFSNKAELISDSASDEAEVKNTEYEVFKSSGMITTSSLPEIIKVNTGDYTINDLQAKFLLAKYENGQWYYAIKINDDENDNNDRVITWSTSGVTGKMVPSDVKLHEINVQTSYKVALGEEVLYKLIEINVPDGYEGSNLGLTDDEFKELITNYLNSGSIYYNNTDYTSFLENYVSTYYFSYNSIISERPDDVPLDKIIQIKSGDDLKIPNNELIDIGIKKEWVNPVTSTANSEITLELYWSYKKASSGMPDESELYLANAADLGLMDSSFSAVKTIPIEYNDDGSVKPNEKIWTDLPNGKNSVPIYYYVKETGYTIGGKTYTLDEDGDFKTASGEIGRYRPTYVGNAANSDATINVRNSHQLMLKKNWKNSSNIELKNIPVEKVVVSIYGIDNDGVKTNEPLFENIELSAAKNWQVDLTDLITPDMDLSQYKSFVAEENEDRSLEDFVVSCVFNLNQDTGEIIVTNKNTVPTEASVKVNKVWSDGTDIHANESIKVTLYQSKTKIDDLSDLALKLKSSANIMQKIDENDKQEYENVTLNSANDWSHTWIGLPLEDENQNKYYYYVLEDKSGIANADKYTETYNIIASTPTKTDYTVTNTRKAIVVQKKWVDEEGNVIPDSELNQESIPLDVWKKVTDPNWKKTLVVDQKWWSGTPENNPDKDTLQKFEDQCNGKIDDCNQLTKTLASAKDNIYFADVCAAVDKDTMLYDGCHPNATGMAAIASAYADVIRSIYTQTSDNLNIMCLGDSITNASDLCGLQDAANENYPKQLENLLKNNYASVSVVKNGQDGQQIPGFADRISGINSDTDIVCVLGGTNDIHQYGGNTKEEIKSRLSTLFAKIKEKNNNVIIVFGSIPHFDFVAQSITSSKVGSITLTKENGWVGAFDITDNDTSAEYYIDESSVPSGWQVSYDEANRYQKLGSTTPLVATNTRNIPKTSLSVEKTWANDTGGEANRDSISLSLLQSTDLRNWVEYDTPMPTPTMVDNVWTYSYTNLPFEDNAGNRYYYKIEEAPMAGYTTAYGTPSYLTAVNGGNAGTLKITNTAAVSLKIRKVWSDIETNDHLNDKVEFKIYREVKNENIDPRPDFDESTLILEIDKTDVGVTVGNTVQVNANKPVTITQSDGSESIFTANLGGNSKTINIEGLQEGSGTITVTDGTDTFTINVTVSAYKLLIDNGEKFVITAGEQNHKLSVTKGGEPFTDVTYTSSDTGILTVSEDGTITTVNAGTATVTVSTGGNVILTQDITVNLPSDFEITGGTEVDVDSDVQLDVNPKYGTFTWISSNESIATVDQTGKVTGISPGKVTITAERNDGKSKQKEINVLDAKIELPDQKEYEIAITENLSDILSIEIKLSDLAVTNQYNKGLQVVLCAHAGNKHWDGTDISPNINWGTDKEITISYDMKNYTKTQLEAISFYIYGATGNIKSIKINTKSTSKSSSLRSASQPQMLVGAGFVTAEPRAAGIDGSTIAFPYTVTISGGSANGWEQIIENLDVYDSNGDPYVYWVEEVSGADGYEASYQFSDGDPDSSSWINSSKPNSDGELVATVRNTKTDTPGYELPHTGGEGVTRYYYTGAALMLLSALAGSNRIRRRLKERRTK